MNLIPESNAIGSKSCEDPERTEGDPPVDPGREAEIRRARLRVFSTLARTYSDNPPANVLLDHNGHAP